MPRLAPRSRRLSGASRTAYAACARRRGAHLCKRRPLRSEVGAGHGTAVSAVPRRGRAARHRRARLAVESRGAGARGAAWRRRRGLLRRRERVRNRSRILVDVGQAERHAAADGARPQRPSRPGRDTRRLCPQRAAEAGVMERRLELLAPCASLLEARKRVGRGLPRDGVARLLRGHAACWDGRAFACRLACRRAVP